MLLLVFEGLESVVVVEALFGLTFDGKWIWVWIELSVKIIDTGEVVMYLHGICTDIFPKWPNYQIYR